MANPKSRAGAALPLLAACAWASPGHTSTSPEDDFLGRVPIVLSATRLAQTPLESPSSVTIIDREMILASGARTVAELMALAPGFQVGFENGNRPVVTYHGLADQFSRRLQVLIDGRSVYTPLWGGVPWENLPLAIEDIERIELIRGPNAATFGPNSFAAVINITTRQAVEDSGTLLAGNRGSQEIADVYLRHGTQVAGGHLRVSLAQNRDSGYDGVFDTHYANMLSARYDRSLSLRDELTLQFGLNEGEGGLGLVGDPIEPARDRGVRNYYHQLRWERAFSPGQSFALQYFSSRYEWHDTNQLTDIPIPGSPVTGSALDNQSALADRHELEAQWILEPAEDLRTVLGGSLREDRVRARGFLGSDEWVSNDVRRLFAHGEYRPAGDWIFNLGAMLEDNDITGTDVSPRLAAIYRIDDGQSARLNLSQATRTPVIFEEFTDWTVAVDVPGAPFPLLVPLWQARGGLAPERITSIELGYRLESLFGVGWDIKLFHDNIDDLIDDEFNPDYVPPIAVPDAFIFVNPNGLAPATHVNRLDVYARGIETGLDVRPTPRTRVVAGFSYVEAFVDDRDHRDSIPRRSFSLLAMFRPTPDHMLSLDYYYQDEFNWLDGTLLDSYEKLDLQFRETFRWGKSRGSFGVVLENVLGRRPAYNASQFQEPRAFARLTLQLP